MTGTFQMLGNMVCGGGGEAGTGSSTSQKDAQKSCTKATFAYLVFTVPGFPCLQTPGLRLQPQTQLNAGTSCCDLCVFQGLQRSAFQDCSPPSCPLALVICMDKNVSKETIGRLICTEHSPFFKRCLFGICCFPQSLMQFHEKEARTPIGGQGSLNPERLSYMPEAALRLKIVSRWSQIPTLSDLTSQQKGKSESRNWEVFPQDQNLK